MVPDRQQLAEVEAGARAGQQIAAGVHLARDLVNRPANLATPFALARQAQALADEFGLVCEIQDETAMAQLGMNALLGVARGSAEPAQFITLEYNPGRDGLGTLALVGKGITFDSGGISLKTAEGMQVCKGDMAGAAAVLGSMRVAAALEIPLHLVGLVPATENLPGGRAYRPGDVLRAMNGKTIEVISTDAEGRLILADALAYAVRFRPQAIIDLATLTNAVAVALGHQALGLFSNDDDLAARLEAAGLATYERVWRLPLFEEYGRQIKSEVADLKNSGGRPGGAITAAMFLQEFVSSVPWAHLDIAGRAFAWTNEDKPYTPHMPSWATGVGVRLLVQLMRDWVNR
jgi:leucyl aminopeptidase